MHRVLIVDDEPKIVELLRLYLELQNCEVIEANNGVQAFEIVNSTRPDIALIDIMMPKMNGFELLKRIREVSNIPVMIISAKIESNDKILGLKLGADDYITKPFDPLEVAERVAANLRRCYHMEEKTALKNPCVVCRNYTLDTEKCILYKEDRVVDLTATEYRIMKLFMENQGRVFTKNQIYEAAWEEEYIADDNSIMVAISKLRAKIEDNDDHCIKTIRNLGYRMV